MTMTKHPELTPPGVFLSPADAGRLARVAMEAEVTASPKPGLVCPDHVGAHKDMDYTHFLRSAEALEPYFGLCLRAGQEHCDHKPAKVFPLLQMLGLTAEAAMLSATGGVNTHKGLIFSLGLVCAGLGRLQGRALAEQRAISPTAADICAEAATLCSGLVARQLAHDLAPLRDANAPLPSALTAGQRLYVSHGITGARGEAEKGFPTAQLALQALRRAENTLPPQHMLPQVLLEIMAVAEDSNVLARGGMAGLVWLHTEAQAVLALGGLHTGAGFDAFVQLRDACAERALSPGGCADMVAVAVFLRLLQS